MGRAWHDAWAEAAGTFAEADLILGDQLGDPLSRLCFEGPPERLNRTDVSQPAIFATSIACWRALLAKLGFANDLSTDTAEDTAPLAATAGLSLGEYTALVVAGAIGFKDGLRLVTLRGRAMQDAAEAEPSGMVALIGADEAQAQAICDQARGNDVLVVANLNAPGQVVLSGHLTALGRAEEAAADAGLRATRLQVAGAFHSPLMQPAADRLREALAEVEIAEPRCPVLSNVTARPHAPDEGGTIAETIRRRLVEQLTSPVRWAESMAWGVEHLAGPGVQLHELAPGKTLAGLMRRIEKSAKVESHDQPD